MATKDLFPVVSTTKTDITFTLDNLMDADAIEDATEGLKKIFEGLSSTKTTGLVDFGDGYDKIEYNHFNLEGPYNVTMWAKEIQYGEYVPKPDNMALFDIEIHPPEGGTAMAPKVLHIEELFEGERDRVVDHVKCNKCQGPVVGPGPVDLVMHRFDPDGHALMFKGDQVAAICAQRLEEIDALCLDWGLTSTE